MIKNYWKSYFSDLYQEPVTCEMAKCIPYSHIVLSNNFMISRNLEQELLIAEMFSNVHTSLIDDLRGEIFASTCDSVPTSLFKEFVYLESQRKSNWLQIMLNTNWMGGFVVIGDNIQIRKVKDSIKADLIMTDKDMPASELLTKKYSKYLISMDRLEDALPYIRDWRKINYM